MTLNGKKVVCIIQGRMSSSRLPGKVLLDLAGKPMLQWVIERVQKSQLIDQTIVATSSDASDDPISEWCNSHHYNCHRGSLHDVLDRFYGAALATNAEIVVRVTADCPFIDAQLIDQTISLLNTPVDQSSPSFTANRLPPPFHRTFPIGLDVEVCSMAALENAWINAKELFHREHVMPYLYEGTALSTTAQNTQWGWSKYGFLVSILNYSQDYGLKRWTVDTAEDLEFARQVAKHLPKDPDFSWLEMLAVIKAHPELEMINAEIRHKTMKEVDERAK